MKPIYCLIVLLVLSCTACASNDESEYTGEISAKTLIADFDKFSAIYQDVEVSDDDKTAIAQVGDKIAITVYLGVWCHDSQREVPRFIRLLEHNSKISVKYIALDRQKQDLAGEASNHNVKYTPTFIVYREGIEVGRIVEKPAVSLARDIKAML